MTMDNCGEEEEEEMRFLALLNVFIMNAITPL
jgi:hypothetical protein